MPRIVGADLCTTSRFHSSMSSIFRAFLGGALLISMSIFALMMWKVRALADSTERTTGLRGQVGFHGNMLIFMGHGWSWGISTLRITMFSNLEPGWTWYIFQPRTYDRVPGLRSLGGWFPQCVCAVFFTGEGFTMIHQVISTRTGIGLKPSKQAVVIACYSML